MRGQLRTLLLFTTSFLLGVVFTNSFGGTLHFPLSVFAQEGGIGPGENVGTNPKIRSNTVSATVPSSSPPSVPILISPNNNSFVTVSKPTFVWEASTDDQSMSSYELSLDGSTLFSGIPLTSTDNSEYTLTYDSVNDRYSLTPKNDLTQGTHTWKIRAIDNQGLGTDSATWSFTIDTQAPSFVITQMGDVTVSISAQDLSTVPSEPVVVNINPVTISGSGEANSNVIVTLVIPGDPTQNFPIVISPSGTWSLNLGTLPRNVDMTLSFTITDQAGNVSILTDVPFTIPSDIIVIPPTPEPTATPTPIPGASPTPEPPATPPTEPAATPAPTPLIVIPVIPPGEIIQEVAQETREILGPLLQNLTQALPEEIREIVETVVETVAPVSGLVVTTAIPITSAVAVASQFGGGISPDLIIKILQALGIIPMGKPRGMVFNSQTYEPVAFALLTIQNSDSDQPLTETVVSNFDGVYSQLKLPPGIYSLLASHQDYTFPTKLARPAYLSMYDYYKGEKFTIKNQSDKPFFFIPMDKNTQKTTWFSKTRYQIFFAQLSRKLSWLIWPLFFFSGLLAIITPSFWNTMVFVIYIFIVLRKSIEWFKVPIVVGRVVDETGQPIERVLVRLSSLAENELVAVSSSDKHGYFRFFTKPGQFTISALKSSYVWYQQNGILSFAELDTRSGPQEMLITMKAAQALTEKELFG